ncbi:MAG: hypothetical protein ABFR82_16800 [Nitrospirota bacterium]
MKSIYLIVPVSILLMFAFALSDAMSSSNDQLLISPFFGELSGLEFEMSIEEGLSVNKELEFFKKEVVFNTQVTYVDKKSNKGELCEYTYVDFTNNKLKSIRCFSHKASKISEFDQYYLNLNKLIKELINRWGEPTNRKIILLGLPSQPRIIMAWEHEGFLSTLTFLPKISYERQVKDGKKKIVNCRYILAIHSPELTESMLGVTFNMPSIYEEVKEEMKKETDIIRKIFAKETD